MLSVSQGRTDWTDLPPELVQRVAAQLDNDDRQAGL